MHGKHPLKHPCFNTLLYQALFQTHVQHASFYAPLLAAVRLVPVTLGRPGSDGGPLLRWPAASPLAAI